MRALVTGGNGFVGAAVVRALLAAGVEVRALVRATSDTHNLAGLEVQSAVGDLCDRLSLDAACRGVDVVFHVAADYRLWVRDPAAMYRNNVDGTVNLLDAAAAAGISRVVYTSSVATLGGHGDGRPADESSASTLADMVGHYKRSKFLAEEAVRERVRDCAAPVVIVNPSTPIGPGDRRPTPTGRMVLDAARGRMPAYVDTGLNLAHVDDVAAGHLLAWREGRIGRRYVLGGDDMTLREILATIASLTGRAPPRIRLPHALVLPVAFAAEVWVRLRGHGEPLATIDGVRMARKRMWFSSARAEHELGYRHRPAVEALADAVRWFDAAGMLRGR